MKFKVILFIVTCLIGTCYAQNTGNCEFGDQIDWVNKQIRHDPIPDNEPMEIQFSYTGTAVPTNQGGNGQPYFDVTTEDSNLFIRTNANFDNFDQDQPKAGSSVSLTLTFDLQCDGGIVPNMRFLVDVYDTNNHDPKFEKDVYTYTMPMPLVPDIDLTYFGDLITAEDIDFSNTAITYAVAPEGSFVVQTYPSDDTKKYRALLKVNEFTRLPGDTTLTITATDNGDTPRSAVATINIQINKDHSIPDIPRFSDASYEFNYSIDGDGKPVITPADNAKTIKVTATDPTQVDVKLDGGGSYFDQSYDSGTQEVTILTTGTPVEMASKDIMVLTLTISLIGSPGDSSTAAILVNIPQDNVVSIPTFSSPYYTAKYHTDTDPHTVELQTDIVVSENADIKLEGDDVHFSISIVDEKWQVKVESPLDEDVIKKGGDIPLILHASVTNDGQVYNGFGMLIIQLPEVVPIEVPTFSQVFYEAKYNVDPSGSDTVEMTKDQIEVVQQDQSVIVSILNDNDPNSDHFSIDPNADNTGYTVSVNQNLDDLTLITEVDIVLTLQASVGGIDEVGKSALVIKLPKEVAPATFSQSYYEADYIMETDTHSIKLRDDAIIDLQGNNLAETHVTIEGEQADHFDISPTSPYELTLKSNLDDNTINQHEDVVITLVASLDGSKLQTKAPVLVIIPDVPKPPKFSEVTYTAKYEPTGDTAVVNLQDGQTISTDALNPTATTVTIDGQYSSNFETEYNDDTQTYTIAVSTTLDQDTVDKKSEIYVTLKATVDGATDSNFATLVLSMPENAESVVPKFSKTLYTATYKPVDDSNTPDTVTIPIPITIISDHAQDTTVQVVDDYEANFEASFDGTSWQLTVIQKLPPTTLNVDKEIFVTLEASLSGSAETGTATLKMDLPEQNLKPAPKFVAPSYIIEYLISDQGDHSIHLISNPITIDSSDGDLVDVTLGDYTSNFKLTRDTTLTKQWNIELGDDLGEDDLTNKPELVITLIAHLDASQYDGTATLVVRLPPQPEEIVAFEEPFYTATYKVDDTNTDSVDADDINVSSGATVEVTGDHSDSFDVPCVDTKCTLIVTKDLLPDVLSTVSEVLLVLVATNDAGVTGKATVIVSLPLQETLKAPEFSEKVYTATYTNDDGTGTLNVEQDVKIVGVDDVTQIDFEIDGENSNYFTFAADGDHWTITATNIPQQVIDSRVSLVLSLKATNSDVSSVSGSAGLVVELPKKIASSPFHFDSAVYMGDYHHEATDSVDFETPIKVEGDSEGAATFEFSGDYHESFSATYDSGVVTINLDTPLTSSDLQDKVALRLDLIATIGTGQAATTTAATLVIRLPKAENPGEGLEFSEVAYIATYTVNGGAGQIDFDSDSGNIEINGIDDPSQVTLTIESGDPNNYFELTSEDDHWLIKPHVNLPDDVLVDEISLLLTIKATQDDLSGEAAVVIKLPKKVATANFEFEEVAYTAIYNDDDTLTPPEKDINLKGSMDGVDVSLDGEYNAYFTATLEGNKVTVELTAPLSKEILDEQSIISFNIIASKDLGTESSKTAFVVELPKSQGSLKFTEVAYTVTYAVSDGTGQVSNENGNIQINGITDTTQVTLSIESGDPDHYFDLTAEDDHWSLTVSTDIPVDVLGEEISLLLTLKATQGALSGEAVLVVKLPKKVSPATFSFTDVAYTADYKAKNGNTPAQLTNADAIALEGQTDGVQIALTGDYATNFKATLGDKKVTIDVDKELSADVLSKQVAVSVSIVAVKDGEEVKAAFVIKLPKITGGTGNNGSDGDDDTSDDKTGLIAAIAVLAVLLVASLVGSAVFYYLKFKRANSYSNIEETSERFRKNSNGADTSHKFEHPTRRATGVIKHSLSDTVDDETTTDVSEPSFEKRKSVQFDTINIDELEIEPEKVEDDLDINEEEENEDEENEEDDDAYESVDGDDRRTSRV